MNKKRLFASVCALSLFVSPINALALTKDETVYSNLNAYGEVKKTTVSNHLSYVGSNDIQDETYLKDILNVNGDEDFSLSDSKLTWKNDGNDIFYQGTTDKDMPVKATIKYYLNGKETSVNDMIGKSGKIKINIQLTNTEANKVKVNGKTTTLYTPYVSTVGLVLDENAKNISVSNGKVVSTGSKSVIAGIAAPGLYDSLKIDELDDLDRVTINYTTSDFQFTNMYIVSTPKLLEDVDTEIFDKLDELTDSIDELQDNMDKIEDGSNKVAKGSQTLTSTVEKSIKSGLDSDTKNVIKKTAQKTVTNTFDDEYKDEIGTEAAAKAVAAIKENSTYVTAKNAVDLIDTLASMAASHEMISENSASAFITAYTASPSSFATLIAGAAAQNPAITSESVTAAAQNYATAKQTMLLMETVAQNVAYSTAITAAQEAATEAAGKAAVLASESTYETVLKTLYGDDKNAGIKALNDGIQTLNDGIEDYNEQGICVLSQYAKKIDNFSSKAEALVNLSKKYDGYGSDNADNTTFISIVKNN